MSKLKIEPINLDKASNAKSISKNISDVVDFQISTASDINRLINELNKVLPLITTPFDDSNIKQQLKQLEKKLKSTPDSVYDDSKIKESVNELKGSIPSEYNDSAIKRQLSDTMLKIEGLAIEMLDIKDAMQSGDELLAATLLKCDDLTGEVAALKTSSAANQKEIRSNRKEAGFKIDVVEQKLNNITEIK